MTDTLYTFNGELTPDDESVGNLIEILLTAEYGDVVTLAFRCDGGCIESMISILNAMKMSKATTQGILLSHTMSAGTFLFLACDSHVVCDHSTFMAHPCGLGFEGGLTDMKTRQKFFRKMQKALVKDYYSGFLTAKEIKKSGRQEVWLSAEQIRERLGLTSELA